MDICEMTNPQIGKQFEHTHAYISLFIFEKSEHIHPKHTHRICHTGNILRIASSHIVLRCLFSFRLINIDSCDESALCSSLC